MRASPHFSPDFGCNLRMGRRYERVLASADLRRTASTTRPAPVRATLVSPTPPRFRSNSGETCGLARIIHGPSAATGGSAALTGATSLRRARRTCSTTLPASGPCHTRQHYASLVSLEVP